ncbi:hypothetical protein JZ751_006012 [Albula glossodonta]|uniref:Uncharacterized protein n=1 Tax=Albula glossodonta TaxID=121402 RepID=A0A8T2P3D9_9TELE|nr:hypothetical protein JZ751_006012 [Albula glossodonta]
MRGIDINTTVRDAALYGNFVKFGKLDASMICWGEAAFGELGLDSFHQDDAFGTTENYPRTTPKADRITSVSAGKGAVAAVRENGTGAFCQQNDMGEHRIIRKPKKLALKKANINLVSCGATQILMVSEKGDVFQRNLLETPAIRGAWCSHLDQEGMGSLDTTQTETNDGLVWWLNSGVQE